MSASLIQKIALSVVLSGVALAIVYEAASFYMDWQARKTFKEAKVQSREDDIEVEFTEEDEEDVNVLSYESILQFPMTWKEQTHQYFLCVPEDKQDFSDDDLLVLRLLPDDGGAEIIEDPEEYEAALKCLEEIQKEKFDEDNQELAKASEPKPQTVDKKVRPRKKPPEPEAA